MNIARLLIALVPEIDIDEKQRHVITTSGQPHLVPYQIICVKQLSLHIP